ncbi:thiamine-phosphate synthase family protein [Halovivax limisalsi]|uniref:thiamine-phosphate synthase family protein n=1 Tax=Halovivax limisalsi TaxID=1453760 RepID=UPI001FFCAA1C|nr:thiamine-phosphate synthase family protein [Halovivax limisalsi]
MRFIEEIVVEEFLPTVRSLLAAELRDRGLTQREVATLLGISQSAVSKYAHGDVRINETVAADDRVAEVIADLADGLADDELTPVQALVELEVLIRELEGGSDLLARMHEEAEPELANYPSFRVHDPENELRTSERVRSSLRRGLHLLENASGFAGLIPAVGSNLVACTPDASGIDDVAGVPGRIVDVKGQATIPADPEFGVSEHVASILLAARANGSDARAAANVRYDDAIQDALADAGHELAEFDESGDMEKNAGRAVAANPDATVLYQTGGEGIEPITYVLGPDPETVADSLRTLASSVHGP